MCNIAVNEIIFSQEQTTSANKILQKYMEFFCVWGGRCCCSTSAENPVINLSPDIPLKCMLSHDCTGLHQDEVTSV